MYLRRLLKLYKIVESDQNFTARQLAVRLRVSRRTLFRDIHKLATAGVKIVYDPSASGFRLSPANGRAGRISAAERQALAQLFADRRVEAQHGGALRVLKKLMGKVSLADLMPRAANGRNGKA